LISKEYKRISQVIDVFFEIKICAQESQVNVVLSMFFVVNLSLTNLKMNAKIKYLKDF